MQTIDINTWNHWTVCKLKSSGLFKNNGCNKLFAYQLYKIQDFTLSNEQGLIGHETQTNQIKTILTVSRQMSS